MRKNSSPFLSKTVHHAVIRAHDYFAVSDRGRAADRFSNFVRPKLFSVSKRNHVKTAVIRADYDFVSAQRGRAIHFAPSGKTPNRGAVVRFKAVKQFIASAKNHPIASDCGRGVIRKMPVAEFPQLPGLLHIHAKKGIFE